MTALRFTTNEGTWVLAGWLVILLGCGMAIGAVASFG